MKNIYGVYFSPTGGTKQCVLALAGGLGGQLTEINLTDFAVREKAYEFQAGDLVILGTPVYGGRMPMIGLLDKLKGHDTKAILVVTYGNRAYEDALLELKNEATARGFVGIAAGAFIARHTYTAKLGGGRPNAEDLSLCQNFGQRVAALLESLNSGQMPSPLQVQLQIKGNQPYRDFKPSPAHPLANDRCNHCGRCAQICPMQAIDPQTIGVDPAKCINCFACVRQCPLQARNIEAAPFWDFVNLLESKFAVPDKEPELFLGKF